MHTNTFNTITQIILTYRNHIIISLHNVALTQELFKVILNISQVFQLNSLYTKLEQINGE